MRAFRLRTMMIAVVVVALLLWGGMLGVRSYDSYKQARIYGEAARGWREIAARDRGSIWKSRSADYYEELTEYYRREMGRPWMPRRPVPPAPEFFLTVEE